MTDATDLDETVRDLEACVWLRGNCQAVLRANPGSVVERHRLNALDRWIARYQVDLASADGLLDSLITDIGRSTT